MVYALPVIEAEIPTNFEEAVNSEKESKWHDAMDDEMFSLHKNKTQGIGEAAQRKESNWLQMGLCKEGWNG